MIEGERRRARHRASMEMHVLPLVVPLVPHAALLALLGVRYALSARTRAEKRRKLVLMIIVNQISMDRSREAEILYANKEK